MPHGSSGMLSYRTCLPSRRHKQLLYCTSFSLQLSGPKTKRPEGKKNKTYVMWGVLYMFKVRAASMFSYFDLFWEE